jgi:hypothetical protein
MAFSVLHEFISFYILEKSTFLSVNMAFREKKSIFYSEIQYIKYYVRGTSYEKREMHPILETARQLNK